MTTHATADPQVFTITRLADAPAGPSVAAVPAAVRMRLWRRAVIGASLLAAPAPVIATAATGHAGWTAILLPAAAMAILGAVVSHAHAETAASWRPEAKPVEISYTDSEGNRVSYRVRPATERA